VLFSHSMLSLDWLAIVARIAVAAIRSVTVAELPSSAR
jgi:hypothetical protein